jgi:hypothetical protein
MSTIDIPRQELDARTDERHRLGTDAADRDHYVDQQLSAIWVVDGDDIVHVEETTAVGAWVDHVGDDCGWLDCHYSDGTLVESLAVALSGRP